VSTQHLSSIINAPIGDSSDIYMNTKEFQPFIPNELTLSMMKQEFNRLSGDARRRGVDWRLSFEAFVEVWRPHWRGRWELHLVLTRNDYAGCWELGNVRIDTRAHQVSAQQAFKKKFGGWLYHPKTGKQITGPGQL
jgi:hypothetical protein